MKSKRKLIAILGMAIALDSLTYTKEVERKVINRPVDVYLKKGQIGFEQNQGFFYKINHYQKRNIDNVILGRSKKAILKKAKKRFPNADYSNILKT